MPSSKPKIQAYVSDRLYNAVQEWKIQNGIVGDSEAIERLLSQALDLPSDRDIPGEVLQEIYQRLDAIDYRLSTLEKGQRTPKNGNSPAELPQPPNEGKGISQEKLKQLCKCNDRIFPKIRNDPDRLAEFTFERTGQAYEYREGKYFKK